jgi:plastocyanin
MTRTAGAAGRRPFWRLGLTLIAAAPVLAARAAAQSVLEQPPNLGGTWPGVWGTIYFNFLHRFDAGEGPARKISNAPTFLLAAGLPGRALAGARYATNSVVVPGFPNEWEFFARWGALARESRHPVDLAVTAAFNQAAESFDAELQVAREVGALRLLGTARGFSSVFRTHRAGFALGGGGVLRLTSHVALAADLAGLVGSPVPASSPLAARHGELAWSAGVQLQIPLTPHTLSIQASNANTTTLQGASFGVSPAGNEFLGVPYWGFEFTIPFTLSRYFRGGRRERPSAPPDAQIAAEVTMTNRLEFEAKTVRIRVGQAVRWRNTSALMHTVTADPAKANDRANVGLPAGARPFDSGNLDPGDDFVHTFTAPGEYRYVCVPHELAGMVGTVIVEEGT